MKLSSALLMFAASVSTAAASRTISGKNVAKVLRTARRVEENGDEDAEDDLAYLSKYNLKLIGCKEGEAVQNPENGEMEYGAVVVRLCPSENGCDSDTTRGCGAGYGDFVVGLSTFVDAYFEDQKDNMQWDDNFEVDRYAQCEEYDQEEAEDDQNQQQYQYFIGPTCAADGLDVRLAVFSDEACMYESETSFETISNGWSLPYGEGGIVSTSCIDCLEYNDDGEYELRELCQQLYEEAPSKCEEKMEYYSYYGQNVQGCDYISELMPAQKSGSAGGKVFGWIVFFVIVAGLAGYVIWWRKKKSSDIVN